jgi:hypothetical protein
LCSCSIVSQHFVAPEGSLPHSQELSTCPHPEPDKSSQYSQIPSLQDPSQYYSPTYILVFLVVSFLPANNIYAFLFSPIHAEYPAHIILLDLIILTLWFSILLRVYYKSSLTSTVRNFSLFYLFIYLFIYIFNLNHTTCSAHPQAILRCG